MCPCQSVASVRRKLAASITFCTLFCKERKLFCGIAHDRGYHAWWDLIESTGRDHREQLYTFHKVGKGKRALEETKSSMPPEGIKNQVSTSVITGRRRLQLQAQHVSPCGHAAICKVWLISFFSERKLLCAVDYFTTSGLHFSLQFNFRSSEVLL